MRTYTEDQVLSAVIRANKAGYHGNKVHGIAPAGTAASDNGTIFLIIESNPKQSATDRHWAD